MYQNDSHSRLCAIVCALVLSLCPATTGEVLVLDDTMTVFDGSIFGGNGCDGEFPLASCKYYNMGGFSVFDVGKNVRHGSSEWRSLMGFDLSGLPDHNGIVIDSATLTLTVLHAVDADSTLYMGFRSLKCNVIEGSSQTYRNAVDSSFTWSARIFMDDIDTVRWQIDGAGGTDDREDSVRAVSPAIGGAGVCRVDMTELLRHWMDSSATERWCLLADTCSVPRTYARKIFCSSEHATAGKRPKLEIFHRSPDPTERPRRNLLSGGLLK